MSEKKKVKITLKKSTISQIEAHKRTAAALGLKRPGSSVVKELNDPVKGMIRSIDYLVKVEEV